MLKPDRTPFVPETTDRTGPGVEHWKQPEINSDKRTDHDALTTDVERRRRVAKLIVKNTNSAGKIPPQAK